MSALPPKADMCSALVNVRFVPIAGIIGIFPRKQPPSWTWKQRLVPDMQQPAEKAEALFFEHPRIGAVISGVGLDAAALNRQLATDDVAAGKVYVADAEVSVRLDPPGPVIHGKSCGGELDLDLSYTSRLECHHEGLAGDVRNALHGVANIGSHALERGGIQLERRGRRQRRRSGRRG